MTDPRTRDVAFIGVYIALILGIGYALFLVPVELVTATIFMSGILMGRVRGMMVGGIAEFLYSVLNPLGSGLLYPTVLIMQVLVMIFVGFCGGMLRSLLMGRSSHRNVMIVCGLAGFVLTLLFDIMASVGFSVAAGFSWKGILGVFTIGTVFHGTRLITNTIVFALLVPPVVRKISAAIPYFQTVRPIGKGV